MSRKILLKNVVCSNYENPKQTTDILIQDGIIQNISSNILKTDVDQVFEAKNCLALPSFIDMQVHLRSPGQEEKEDLTSGTQAAARGGYTHVACMPNTKPVLDNAKYLKWINEQVQSHKTFAHVYPIAAMTENLEGKIPANYNEYKTQNVIAITDDGFGVQDADVMEQVCIKAKQENLILMQHCEVEQISHGASFHEGVFTKKINIAGYPGSAEYLMIERDLKFVEKYNVPYHVLHLSTKEGLELIRNAKKKKLPVTCEVTPHHLLLCDEDIKEPYSLFKMNPPLRSKEDRQALQLGLANGEIDIVSTDHAPHTFEEKSRPFELAPFGIIGLETAWALLYTELYLKKLISFERLLDAFSYKARKIFSLPSSTLQVGQIANITLVNIEKIKVVEKAELYSKSMNTPFLGKKLKGWPVLTLWNGRQTYKDTQFFGA